MPNTAVMQSQDTNKRIRLIMELRRKGVSDMAVLGALETIPRDAYVPNESRDQAWDDTALPIGRGQTISQPYVVAKMTSALNLTDRDRVLEIGTGCGYQTAILAKLSRRVYTIERHEPLSRSAQERLEFMKIRNVTALAADGMKGWPHNPEPFDKIIVTAASRSKPPQALLDQLKDGGIMVVPVDENGTQTLRRYKKESDTAYAVQDLMPVRFVPLLPDVEV